VETRCESCLARSQGMSTADAGSAGQLTVQVPTVSLPLRDVIARIVD
jgi:hypothetical protein